MKVGFAMPFIPSHDKVLLIEVDRSKIGVKLPNALLNSLRSQVGLPPISQSEQDEAFNLRLLNDT